MKLIIISDTHKQEENLVIPDGDVLIHCGDTDVCELRDLAFLNKFFEKQPHKLIIYVPGNHDFLCQRSPTLVKNTLTKANVLIDEELIYEGITFYGSPWTPRFGGWAFMQDRGPNIKKYWDNIPSYTDVLITHGPAYGVLDKVPHKGSVGCEELYKAVQRIQPKIHTFGHIHPGYGSMKLTWDNGNITRFVNAAQLDDYYDLVNEPIVVEI